VNIVDHVLWLMKVLSYGRKRKVILEAPLYDKDCVLGSILAAHFLSSSDPSRANSYVEAAASNLEQSTPYEKAVYEAVTYLISEDRDDDLAFEMHTKLLKRFPKDLASLKRAQLLSFYMGQPDPFLGLVQQVLPANQEESYIHGLLAFPLLELGRMEEAAAASRKGYEINKEDAWAHHCLCHVLQHECRFKEAVEFMEALAGTWPSCSSFMYTHNWWHVALCYLEGGSPMSKVEEIYDHHIWKELEKDDAVPPEVILFLINKFMLLRHLFNIQLSATL
jgi:tetratricopeptide (TPR) repeat protein